MKKFYIVLLSLLILAYGCEKAQAKDPVTDPVTDPTEQKDTLDNPEPIVDPVDTTSTPDPIEEPVDDPSTWPDPFMAQIPDGGRFPLMAFIGVDGNYSSPERMQEAIDFGLTHSLSSPGTMDIAIKMLEDAKGLDIQMVMDLRPWMQNTQQREETIAKVKDYPNLWGYFVDDEPSADEFARVGEMASDIRRIDPDHGVYANLYPQVPQFYVKEMLKCDSYDEYVQKYLETIPVTILSFDRYPVTSNGSNATFDNSLYSNLEVCAAAAEQSGLPLWAFFLTTEHYNYPVPEIEHLRVQGYSNLAYGAQSLECFTYWCPYLDDYLSAPINKDGQRSNIYYVGQAFMQEVNKLSWVWKGCKRVCTGFSIPKGRKLPTATTDFAELENVPSKIKSLTCSKSMVLGSILTNNGYNFLMVVNASLVEATYTLEADHDVFMISKDGKLSKNISKDVTLTPGDMQLYIWE